MSGRTFGWDPEALENKDKERQRSADEAALRREVLTSARAYIARRKAEEDAKRHQPTGPIATTPTFTPAGLMSELRLGRNLACSILEELERAGELLKISGKSNGIAYRPSPAAKPVGRGYALPLSQKEASHLLNVLDWYLGRQDPKDGWASATASGHVTILREVRSRLKGGPL